MGLVPSPDEQDGLALRMFLKIYEHYQVSLLTRVNISIHYSNNRTISRFQVVILGLAPRTSAVWKKLLGFTAIDAFQKQGRFLAKGFVSLNNSLNCGETGGLEAHQMGEVPEFDIWLIIVIFKPFVEDAAER